MKKSNKLKTLVLFELNEGEAIREYLEEMARKGWALKSIHGFYHFERIEPQALHYAVEIFEKASEYDSVPAPRTQEYIEYCRAAGWAFVCNHGQMNIFVSACENPIPIETDEARKLKAIVRGMVKKYVVGWFFLPLLFLLNMGISYLNFEGLVSSPLGMAGFFLQGFVVIFLLCRAFGFLGWAGRQKRRQKQGLPLEAISRKKKKRRGRVRLLPLAVVLTVLLYVLAQALFDRDFLTAVPVAIAILVSFAILFLMYIFQKGEFSRTANILVPFFLGLGSVLLISVLTGFFIFTDGLLSGSGTEIDGFRPTAHSQTFLASSTMYEYTAENGEIWGGKIFKSKYDAVIRGYLRAETHVFFWELETEKLRPEWGAKESYASNGTIYLCYEDYVLSFYTSEPMTGDQIERVKRFAERGEGG